MDTSSQPARISPQLPLSTVPSPADAWARGTAAAAGAPSTFSLLPCVPSDVAPAWVTRTTGWGSGTASALLAVDMQGKQLTGTTLLSPEYKHLWFAACTPYTVLRGRRHHRRQLVHDAMQRMAGSSLLVQPKVPTQCPGHDGVLCPPNPSGAALGSPCGSEVLAPSVLVSAEQGPLSLPPDSQQPSTRMHTLQDARQLLWGMAANMQSGWWGLRLFAYALSWLYRLLFRMEVYVDAAGLQRLRRLAPQHQFVFIPTHKSHIDYLTLSYVMFAAGLECPHIAAGDNLNLPIIGSLLAHGGAFFIRRSTRSAADSALYKQALAAYLESVLAAGHALEFFAEGGRSRDGAIQRARLGLLAMVVAAVLDETCQKKLLLVPVTISYDSPLEEASMRCEVAGQPKSKETLFALLVTAGRMVRQLWRGQESWARRPPGCGGRCGCVAISFGDPLDLKRFLKDRSNKKRLYHKVRPTESADEAPSAFAADDGAPIADPPPPQQQQPKLLLQDIYAEGSDIRRKAIEALGETLHARMRAINTLPSSTLLVLAVMQAVELLPEPFRHGYSCSPPTLYPSSLWVSINSVNNALWWLEGELTWRGVPFMSICNAAAPAQIMSAMCRLMASCIDSDVDLMPSSSKRGPSRLRAPGSPMAALARWYRVNQMLPTLAPEAILSCALLSKLRQQHRDRAPPWVERQVQASNGHIANGSSATASSTPWWGFPAARLSSGLGVPERQVVTAAMWLRKLLKGSLDTALGGEGFKSAASIVAIIDRMVMEGSLVAQINPAISTSDAPEQPSAMERYLSFPTQGPGAVAGPFSASLLRPLLSSHVCCTYMTAHAVLPLPPYTPAPAPTPPAGALDTPSCAFHHAPSAAQHAGAMKAPAAAAGQDPEEPVNTVRDTDGRVESEALIRHMQAVLMEQQPMPPLCSCITEAAEAAACAGQTARRSACEQVRMGLLPDGPLPSLMVLQQIMDALTDAGWVTPWEKEGDASQTSRLGATPNFGISVQSSVNLVAMTSAAGADVSSEAAETPKQHSAAPTLTKSSQTVRSAAANIGGLAGRPKKLLVSGKLLQGKGWSRLELYLQELLSFAWTGPLIGCMESGAEA